MQRLLILSFAFRGQGVTRASWLMPSNLAVKLGERKKKKNSEESRGRKLFTVCGWGGK